MSRFYRPMLSWFSLGLVLAACGEPELETNNCQNECAADERCINGECAQTQVSNGDASSPDSGVDAGPFLNDPSDAAKRTPRPAMLAAAPPSKVAHRSGCVCCS